MKIANESIPAADLPPLNIVDISVHLASSSSLNLTGLALFSPSTSFELTLAYSLTLSVEVRDEDWTSLQEAVRQSLSMINGAPHISKIDVKIAFVDEIIDSDTG